MRGRKGGRIFVCLLVERDLYLEHVHVVLYCLLSKSVLFHLLCVLIHIWHFHRENETLNEAETRRSEDNFLRRRSIVFAALQSRPEAHIPRRP